MKKYVAYYRVSTAKQGQSGLGLEAQRAAVQAFIKCDTCILREFVEVESEAAEEPLPKEVLKHGQVPAGAKCC